MDEKGGKVQPRNCPTHSEHQGPDALCGFGAGDFFLGGVMIQGAVLSNGYILDFRITWYEQSYLLSRWKTIALTKVAVPRKISTTGSQLEIGVIPAIKVVLVGNPAIANPKAKKTPEKKLPAIFLAISLVSFILEHRIQEVTTRIMTASPMVMLALCRCRYSIWGLILSLVKTPICPASASHDQNKADPSIRTKITRKNQFP